MIHFARMAHALSPVSTSPPVSTTTTESHTEDQDSSPSLVCLSETICTLKERIRWRTPKWTPAFCSEIARAVEDSATRHHLSPALMLAVMINESDLNEKAFRTSMKNKSVYAKDGGLMGIRCIPNKQNRCINGNVRGLTFSEVMNPVTNIELGARELARYRDGEGTVSTVTLRVRDKGGRLRLKQKNIPCQHRSHAFWAHYNHGPRYIDHGPARHYPHRIAVLYYAVARAMNLDTRELTSMKLTVNDPGKRHRSADRPIEPRHQKLCQTIRDVGPLCGQDAQTAQITATQSSAAN